ncbi:hypothetical protein L1F30_16255 [Simiduia sp. 21SJ11W-1]|nr:hypothetical protein [Simiduia sp. 21SJ11W-1]UTA47695.1 hypothetical protein L1F30_16255 [Simiduia sp. 21SJ11W-1]
MTAPEMRDVEILGDKIHALYHLAAHQLADYHPPATRERIAFARQCI